MVRTSVFEESEEIGVLAVDISCKEKKYMSFMYASIDYLSFSRTLLAYI